MINPWFQFAACALVIVLAGGKLTKNASVVADNTGIGTAWVGALMLPMATSLPELVTTLRAVAINAPDLALGNLLGSCLYNLTLLALIDLLEGRRALTAQISRGHTVTASLSIITVCLGVMAILGLTSFPLGWVGIESVLIAIVYIVGGRLLYRYEKKNMPPMEEEKDEGKEERSSTAKALLSFVAAAVFIVAAGVLLTDATDRIALETGLGHTFVGSIFLAISTSLPETVTTITAVRLGLLDMAVANVFGANFMNFFIIFIADLFYRQGPLLYNVSDNHILSGIIVIMMSTFIIFGLTYRSEKKLAGIGLDALMVFGSYFVAVYALFKLGGN